LIYGYFDTLEAVNYYSVKRVAEDEASVDVDSNQTSAFRSPLTQESYICEKEIPSLLKLKRSH